MSTNNSLSPLQSWRIVQLGFNNPAACLPLRLFPVGQHWRSFRCWVCLTSTKFICKSIWCVSMPVCLPDCASMYWWWVVGFLLATVLRFFMLELELLFLKERRRQRRQHVQPLGWLRQKEGEFSVLVQPRRDICKQAEQLNHNCRGLCCCDVKLHF